MGGHDAALFLFDVDGGFLDVGGLEGAEVVGGLEALVPGTAIHVGEGLHLGGGEEEVDALALVDPLLAAGGGVDDVFVVDAEDGLVLVLEGFRDVVDGVELTVEILELVEHFLIPEVGLLEVFDELAVEDDEVAGEVGFDVEVLASGSQITDIIFICGMGSRKLEGWWYRRMDLCFPGRWAGRYLGGIWRGCRGWRARLRRARCWRRSDWRGGPSRGRWPVGWCR